MVFLVGTASLFKEPIHFKTLGLHATEYGQVFSQHDSSKIMCREQSDLYCRRIEPICLSKQDLWETYTCGWPV